MGVGRRGRRGWDEGGGEGRVKREARGGWVEGAGGRVNGEGGWGVGEGGMKGEERAG